jgi:hypothetical protein
MTNNNQYWNFLGTWGKIVIIFYLYPPQLLISVTFLIINLICGVMFSVIGHGFKT